MKFTSLEDPVLITNACNMRQSGMFVSDISKILSKETGQKITQMALWRLFDSLKEESQKELLESDYPSLEDIAYIFNKKFQKEKNSTVLKHLNTTIRRDLMLRILTNYCNSNFTYYEVRKECNDRDGESNFKDHWNYLLKFHYIEKVDEYRFKFCDRVKKWKNFGQV